MFVFGIFDVKQIEREGEREVEGEGRETRWIDTKRLRNTHQNSNSILLCSLYSRITATNI